MGKTAEIIWFIKQKWELLDKISKYLFKMTMKWEFFMDFKKMFFLTFLLIVTNCWDTIKGELV